MQRQTEPAGATDLAEKPRQAAREELLLAALASGVSVAEAARRSGMSPRTVHRRLADPAFLRELQEARSRMVDAALGQLTESLTAAATSLRDLLQSDSDTIRLSAARAVFEIAGRLRDQVEFERRLTALEAHNANPTDEN